MVTFSFHFCYKQTTTITNQCEETSCYQTKTFDLIINVELNLSIEKCDHQQNRYSISCSRPNICVVGVLFNQCMSKMVELGMVMNVEMHMDLDLTLWQYHCSFGPDNHPIQTYNANQSNQIMDWLH